MVPECQTGVNNERLFQWIAYNICGTAKLLFGFLGSFHGMDVRINVDHENAYLRTVISGHVGYI